MRQQTIIAELRRHLVEVRTDPCYEGLQVRGGGPGENDLCPLIAQLENVVALQFASTDIADDGFEQLGRLRGLRSLEIHSARLTTTSLATLERFTQLREVDFNANVAGDVLASSLGKLALLQRVRMYKRGLTSHGLTFALRWPQMQYLDISCNPVCEGFEVLQHCQGLWKLDISDCAPLAPTEIANIAHLASLTDLSIGGCGVDDSMFAQIAEMARLRSLFIPCSPLTPAAALSLPRLDSLEELMWPAEAIDDANLTAFGHCRTLKDLMFWMNPKIPESILNQVQRLMPGCRVVQL